MSDTEPTPRITRKVIIGCTAAVMGLTREDITGQGRFRHQVRARWVCVVLIREFEPGISRPQLGEVLGNRDHTTMIHAIRASERLLRTDPEFAAIVEACRKRVLSWRPTAPQTVDLKLPLPELPPEHETPPAAKPDVYAALSEFARILAEQDPPEVRAMRESVTLGTLAFAKRLGHERPASVRLGNNRMRAPVGMREAAE